MIKNYKENFSNIIKMILLSNYRFVKHIAWLNNKIISKNMHHYTLEGFVSVVKLNSFKFIKSVNLWIKQEVLYRLNLLENVSPSRGYQETEVLKSVTQRPGEDDKNSVLNFNNFSKVIPANRIFINEHFLLRLVAVQFLVELLLGFCNRCTKSQKA